MREGTSHLPYKCSEIALAVKASKACTDLLLLELSYLIGVSPRQANVYPIREGTSHLPYKM